MNHINSYGFAFLQYKEFIIGNPIWFYLHQNIDGQPQIIYIFIPKYIHAYGQASLFESNNFW
jgi:hypothetical protein